MKRFTLLKTMLLLCALIVGSGSAWADAGDPQWTYTVSSSDGSKLNTTKKTFTVDGSHVWSYANSTMVGSAAVTIGTANSKGCIKFGDAGARHYNPIVLTTDAFSDYKITKVSLDVNHNGKQAGSLTVKQGSITIGTASVSKFSGEWKTITCSQTNEGNGGTLEITYSVPQACYINKIQVWYEEMERDYWVVTYNFNDEVTPNEKVNVNKTDAEDYVLKATPTRLHFDFLGWNDGSENKDGGTAYPLTGDKTFTAQWEWDNTYTTYKKSDKNDLATGAKYIMVGSNASAPFTWKYCTAMGANTYLNADVVGEHGTLDDSEAKLVDEMPEVITLNETTDGWTMTTINGIIGLTGDKKLGYNDGDTTWDLGGTTELPTFSAEYNSTNYIMKYNSGVARFNAYTSDQQNAYFYRLDDGKDIYTLTLDFNDGETADGTHRVLEGASYTLTAPTREGYTFVGWNTEEDGSGTNYAAGAYTMPAANTTLYAVWAVSVTVTDTGWATYCSEYALDFTNVTGLTAYTASVDGTAVKFTKVTGKVPANTGLLVGGTTTNVPVCASADPVENLLEGVTEETVKDAESIYVLMKGAKGLGFYKNTNAFTVRANSAYLPATSVPGAKSRSFISFDDETTGIEAINSNPETVKENAREYYNLNGQRVTTPTKGLYIVNGKKVIINK